MTSLCTKLWVLQKVMDKRAAYVNDKDPPPYFLKPDSLSHQMLCQINVMSSESVVTRCFIAASSWKMWRWGRYEHRLMPSACHYLWETSERVLFSGAVTMLIEHLTTAWILPNDPWLEAAPPLSWPQHRQRNCYASRIVLASLWSAMITFVVGLVLPSAFLCRVRMLCAWTYYTYRH